MQVDLAPDRFAPHLLRVVADGHTTNSVIEMIGGGSCGVMPERAARKALSKAAKRRSHSIHLDYSLHSVYHPCSPLSVPDWLATSLDRQPFSRVEASARFLDWPATTYIKDIRLTIDNHPLNQYFGGGAANLLVDGTGVSVLAATPTDPTAATQAAADAFFDPERRPRFVKTLTALTLLADPETLFEGGSGTAKPASAAVIGQVEGWAKTSRIVTGFHLPWSLVDTFATFEDDRVAVLFSGVGQAPKYEYRWTIDMSFLHDVGEDIYQGAATMITKASGFEQRDYTHKIFESTGKKTLKIELEKPIASTFRPPPLWT